MAELKEKLTDAAEEIRFLLGRGYPKNSAVRFVGDHYRLKDPERFILSRNVLKPAIAKSRREKRCACTDMEERHLVVDGYNVLITLENYLKGEEMWIGDDGFVRDSRGVFSNHVNDRTTYGAVELMMAMITAQQVESAIIYLDMQMSKSGELAVIIRQKMEEHRINGNVLTSKMADYELKQVSGNSIVATADGAIIDAVDHVVDIPACVIAEKESNKIFLPSLRQDMDHSTEGKR